MGLWSQFSIGDGWVYVDKMAAEDPNDALAWAASGQEVFARLMAQIHSEPKSQFKEKPAPV